MKRAVLWLGPLACLALACLYAYAWFNRDPLAVAFDQIEIGMSGEDVVAILGDPCDAQLRRLDADKTDFVVSWRSKRRLCNVAFDGIHTRRVVGKDLYRLPDKSFPGKILNWMRDASFL